GLASGMGWRELADMARDVFWPSLLHGGRLEQFCQKHLPRSFADLQLPFAALATALPGRRVITLTSGKLASAINASCCIPVRRAVRLNGQKLKDGGLVCVLPSLVCREMGANFVIASDVWEVSAFMRGVGVPVGHRL